MLSARSCGDIIGLMSLIYLGWELDKGKHLALRYMYMYMYVHCTSHL